ncbi:hypothetical protein ABH925_007284 [Streptacidiphilus sp. EB129]
MRDLARPYWQGDTGYQDFTDYRSAIPIVVTTLDRLQQHGPLGAVWWRLGHSGLQTLGQALANPDGLAAYRARQAAEAEAERLAAEAEEREREHQEREDSRCPRCRRAADEYEDWDDAASGGHPCQPCVRAQQEAAEIAARQQLDQAIADAPCFLKDWDRGHRPAPCPGPPGRRLGRKELHAAWKARQDAAQRPAPPAPTPRPAPAARPPHRTPAAARRPGSRTHQTARAQHRGLAPGTAGRAAPRGDPARPRPARRPGCAAAPGGQARGYAGGAPGPLRRDVRTAAQQDDRPDRGPATPAARPRPAAPPQGRSS